MDCYIQYYSVIYNRCFLVLYILFIIFIIGDISGNIASSVSENYKVTNVDVAGCTETASMFLYHLSFFRKHLDLLCIINIVIYYMYIRRQSKERAFKLLKLIAWFTLYGISYRCTAKQQKQQFKHNKQACSPAYCRMSANIAK